MNARQKNKWDLIKKLKRKKNQKKEKYLSWCMLVFFLVRTLFNKDIHLFIQIILSSLET